MVTAGNVAQAPKAAAAERPVKIALAMIFLLLFCVGAFYLAAACIPLARIHDIIPTVDPEGLTTFTRRYYQYVRTPHYYEQVRAKLVFFGATALFLAALQVCCLRPLTRAVEVCLADAHRLTDSFRRWCRGVPTAEWLLLSGLTTLAGVIRFHYLNQPMRFDEVTTLASYASRPFYVVLSVYAAPNNHVFHTILVRCVYLLFGNQPWALRLPALLAGMCLIPATYAFARTFYGQDAATLAAGLVGASSMMIDYSTQARGYTMVCLFSVMLFWLSMFLARNHNWAGWVLLGLLGALGFYTIPIMLYPYATAMAWLLLSSLLGETISPPKTILVGLLGAGLLSVFMVFWLYSPIFVVSGPGLVFANHWVESLSLPVFLRNFPFSLHSTWRTWNRDWPLALTLLLGVGFVISSIWSRQCGRHRIPVPLAMVVAVSPLLLIQRVVPFERVWLFALPVFLASASAGLVLVVGSADIHGRFRLWIPVVAILISLWAGICSYRGNSVYLRNPGRGLEQTARWLKTELKPGDSVLVAFMEKRSLSYYFDREGVSPRYIDAPSSRSVFVVVSEVAGSEPLPTILGVAKIQPECAAAAQRMSSFDAVSIYEISVPSSSPSPGCTVAGSTGLILTP